jgi:hypothetical protein
MRRQCRQQLSLNRLLKYLSMSIPTFATGQKFAMMAIGMVYTDLPDYDLQLPDGTWVLNHVPVEIQKHWIEWIGSIRTDQVRHANLVLLRFLKSANPETAWDEEQFRLTNHLNKLFSGAMPGRGTSAGQGTSAISGTGRTTIRIRERSSACCGT